MKTEITNRNASHITHEEIIHQRILTASYFLRLDGTMPDAFKGCDLDEPVARELSGTTRKLSFAIPRKVALTEIFLFKGREYFADRVATEARGRDISSFVDARREDAEPCGLQIFKRGK